MIILIEIDLNLIHVYTGETKFNLGSGHHFLLNL